MSETPEISGLLAPERSPLWAASAAAKMLERQAARGWKRTACVSDFDNSWFSPATVDDTNRLGRFMKGHDIPTIIVTGNGFDGLSAKVEANGLAKPEVIISAVGTEIHILTEENGRLVYRKDEEFDAYLKSVAGKNFDRDAIVRKADAFISRDGATPPWNLEFQVPAVEHAFLEGHPDAGHQPYKVSFYAMATDQTRDQMEAWVRAQYPGIGISVCEEIGYNTAHRDSINMGQNKRYCIDLLPITPKAAAANYVTQRLEIQRAANIGDSGNDAKLFTATDVGYGIIAGGNTPELPQQVISRFAGGGIRNGVHLVYQPDGTGGFRRRKIFYDSATATRGAGTVLEAARTWLKLITPFEPNETIREQMVRMQEELAPREASNQ